MKKKLQRFTLIAFLMGVMGISLPLQSLTNLTTTSHETAVTSPDKGQSDYFDARPQGWPNSVD